MGHKKRKEEEEEAAVVADRGSYRVHRSITCCVLYIGFVLLQVSVWTRRLSPPPSWAFSFIKEEEKEENTFALPLLLRLHEYLQYTQRKKRGRC